jgi:prefoldin beta subunit
MGELQKKLQDLSEDYQKLQAGKAHNLSWEAYALLIFRPELSTTVEARQQLESQQQENTTVQKVRSEDMENTGRD